jgi:hypothetical protein
MRVQKHVASLGQVAHEIDHEAQSNDIKSLLFPRWHGKIEKVSLNDMRRTRLYVDTRHVKLVLPPSIRRACNRTDV